MIKVRVSPRAYKTLVITKGAYRGKNCVCFLYEVDFTTLKEL
jgi:hypothetical protein